MQYKFTLSSVFIVAVGAMLSGLFILPGLAFEKAGPSMILGFIVSGLLALTGMLSKGELTSAMPKSGVAYFYVTRSFGAAVGTMYGLIIWFSLTLKSAMELIAVAIFLRVFFDVNFYVIAIGLALFLVAINCIGIQKVKKIQSFLVIVILVMLGVYIFKGTPMIEPTYFSDFAPGGVSGIFATAGFVFICYGGLLKVASVAEETENPGRNIPWGMILSFIFITVIYTIVLSVTVGVVDPEIMRGTLMPISDGAKVMMGGVGYKVFAIAASLAIISATNAGILSASRYPMALSRDGMLPEIFKKMNRFHVPLFSLLVTGGLIIAFLFVDLKVVVKAASAVLILTYMFACLTLIVMRESHLSNYRPQFRAPLYPWLQIVGILGYCLLLYGIGIQSFLMMLALFMVGFIIYWIYGRKRSDVEYALLHIIERITQKELTDHGLERELKQILRDRDDLGKDRFDYTVDHAIVLDLEEKMALESFFKLVSEKLGERIERDPTILFEKFMTREGETTTAITPFLAIPHIFLEGEGLFEMMIVRSKEGIYFSEEHPEIHMVILMAETKDERNFHLKVLAKVAQIVYGGEFGQQWMRAKTTHNLRDVIHLGGRMRSEPATAKMIKREKRKSRKKIL